MSEDRGAAENPLGGVDRPRPLPAGLRARLEEQLIGRADSESPFPEGLDRPRPLPDAARERIVGELVRRRSPRWMPAVAAVVALLLGAGVTVSLVTERRGEPAVDTFAAESADEPAASALAAPDSAGGAGSGFGPPPFTLGNDGPGVAAPGPADAPAAAMGRSSTEDFAAESAPPAYAGPPLSIELSGPDSDVSAGFRAYLDQVNARGGVHGRPLTVASPGEEAKALATVNTSLSRPIAPGGRRPLLEGPAAGDRLLSGQVFSFSAPPERLAYLAIDGLDLRRARAVIFTGEGVFAGSVADAFATALGSQNASVQRVAAPGGVPERWPEADVAVLSLDGEGTREWLRAARARGYSPRRGVAGIYNLAEPSLVGLLPEGSAVVSPYAAPQAGESQAMESAAGSAPSFGFTHGWVTAKAVALALWQSGATTAEGLGAALAGLSGQDLNGLIAPYSVRPGTNARTPEGILSQVRGEKLVALGGFRGSGRTK